MGPGSFRRGEGTSLTLDHVGPHLDVEGRSERWIRHDKVAPCTQQNRSTHHEDCGSLASVVGELSLGRNGE